MRGRSQASSKRKNLTRSQCRKNNPDPMKLKVFRVSPWLPTEAKELWKRVSPELLRLKVLSALDKPSFEAMCLAYSLMKQAGEELSHSQLTVTGERGSLKKHPIFSIYKTNAELFLKFSELFGLSPRSRELLSIDPNDEVDDFEFFLDGK